MFYVLGYIKNTFGSSKKSKFFFMQFGFGFCNSCRCFCHINSIIFLRIKPWSKSSLEKSCIALRNVWVHLKPISRKKCRARLKMFNVSLLTSLLCIKIHSSQILCTTLNSRRNKMKKIMKFSKYKSLKTITQFA